ncbi:unnamed protein product [Diplocarpon coronariae]
MDESSPSTSGRLRGCNPLEAVAGRGEARSPASGRKGKCGWRAGWVGNPREQGDVDVRGRTARILGQGDCSVQTSRSDEGVGVGMPCDACWVGRGAPDAGGGGLASAVAGCVAAGRSSLCRVH